MLHSCCLHSRNFSFQKSWWLCIRYRATREVQVHLHLSRRLEPVVGARKKFLVSKKKATREKNKLKNLIFLLMHATKTLEKTNRFPIPVALHKTLFHLQPVVPPVMQNRRKAADNPARWSHASGARSSRQQQHQQHHRKTQKDSGKKGKAGTVAEQLPSSTHPLPSGSTTISHVLSRGAVYLFSPSRQIRPRENRLPWRSVLHSSFHSVL